MGDTAAELAAIFARDAELFRVISQHGFRTWVRAGSNAPLPEPEDDRARKQADAKHAPLFRAIKQSGKH